MTRSRVWLTLWIVLVGCGSSEPPGASFAQPCLEDRDCKSGLCHQGAPDPGVCTNTCADDSDCTEGSTCGTAIDGARVCLSRCEDFDEYRPEGFVCVDGAYTHCDHAGNAWNCHDCGCTDGKFCGSADECIAPRPVGEPCVQHGECASGNCSEPDDVFADPPGRCLVARGASCTPGGDECESCSFTADGLGSCDQHCTRWSGCSGGMCVFASQDSAIGTCRGGCGALASCPEHWTCTGTNVGFEYCGPPRRCEPGEGDSCYIGEFCDEALGICRPE